MHGLHPRVVGAAAAFRRDPHDILCGVFDVAGFAMHTVLRIDLQPVRVVEVFDVFINTCRAVPRLGPGVGCQIDVDRNTRVPKRQMCGLMLFMIGIADEDAGEFVKCDLTVGLGIGDLWTVFGRLELGVVRYSGMNRPRRCFDTQFRQQPQLNAIHDAA